VVGETEEILKFFDSQNNLFTNENLVKSIKIKINKNNFLLPKKQNQQEGQNEVAFTKML
jgi:hypothetical protein